MTEQTAIVNQTMFPKQTKRKYLIIKNQSNTDSQIGRYTLVMEMVDILVRLIDVTMDKFHLQDVGICEFSVRNRVSENSLEIVSAPLSH
jgi:hypothetical protein